MLKLKFKQLIDQGIINDEKQLASAMHITPKALIKMNERNTDISLSSLFWLCSSTNISSNYFIRKDMSLLPPTEAIVTNKEHTFDYSMIGSISAQKDFIQIIYELNKLNSKLIIKPCDSLFVDRDDEVFNSRRFVFLLNNANYTINSFAEILGVSVSTVKSWISGTPPHVKQFTKIVNSLQCNSDYLLNLCDNPNLEENKNIIKLNTCSSKLELQFIYQLYYKLINNYENN